MQDFEWDEIESIDEIEEGECYDICLLEEDVLDGEPNFIANGFVVHNSGITEEFLKRKTGKSEEDWKRTLPKKLLPILKPTQGLCVCQEHNVLTENGWINLRDMVANPDAFVGEQLPTYNEVSGDVELGKITAVWDKGLKECYEITLEDNTTLVLTADHIVYTNNGEKKVVDLTKEDKLLKAYFK